MGRWPRACRDVTLSRFPSAVLQDADTGAIMQPAGLRILGPRAQAHHKGGRPKGGMGGDYAECEYCARKALVAEYTAR